MTTKLNKVKVAQSIKSQKNKFLSAKIILFVVVLLGIAVLAALFIIGGSFSFQIGQTRNQIKQQGGPQPTQQPVQSPPPVQDTWKEFTNEQFGYSISYPADWIVKEQPSQETPPELLLLEPTGLAFLRIVVLQDPALTDAESIRASIEAYKQELRKDDKEGSRLFDFQSDVQENLGTFSAYGEFYVGDSLYRYEERGLLTVNGRVILMRGAVFVTKFDKLAPTLTKMMDSFRANQ